MLKVIEQSVVDTGDTAVHVTPKALNPLVVD